MHTAKITLITVFVTLSTSAVFAQEAAENGSSVMAGAGNIMLAMGILAVVGIAIVMLGRERSAGDK